jgi:hypothetical protein
MERKGFAEDLPDEPRCRDFDHKGANRVALTGSKTRRILDLGYLPAWGSAAQKPIVTR